jgi:hypothetical protein
MRSPSKMEKTISRSTAISDIDSAHYTRLKFGRRVDANGSPYAKELYTGKTINAHVNHYQCRSFRRWMRRVERGDVNFNAKNSPANQEWRLTEQACLRQFVTTVAASKNEMTDEYMLKYASSLKEMVSSIKSKRDSLCLAQQKIQK